MFLKRHSSAASPLPQRSRTADGILDGTATLGSGTLSGGKATLSTAGLAAGSHSATATYSGNSNYNSSTSAARSQTVNSKTNTTITLKSRPIAGGVLFTATVSPSSATGLVEFLDNGQVIGRPP